MPMDQIVNRSKFYPISIYPCTCTMVLHMDMDRPTAHMVLDSFDQGMDGGPTFRDYQIRSRSTSCSMYWIRTIRSSVMVTI